MQYRQRKYGKYALIILIPLLLGILSYFSVDTLTGFFVKNTASEEREISIANLSFSMESQLSTAEYTEVEVSTVPGGILLTSNCTGVFIAMSSQKTFTIKRGIHNELDIRPNDHDITYDIITHYGSNVTLARISRMNNNFYYADLLIQQEGDLLELDSRPSDAIALATRFHAPVYMHKTILRRQGINVCNT